MMIDDKPKRQELSGQWWKEMEESGWFALAGSDWCGYATRGHGALLPKDFSKFTRNQPLPSSPVCSSQQPRVLFHQIPFFLSSFAVVFCERGT